MIFENSHFDTFFPDLVVFFGQAVSPVLKGLTNTEKVK